MVNVSRPRVVGSVTLGHGVNEFFAVAIPPIIPLLVAELGISYAQAGFLLTIFFIMYSIFQLPAGIIGDWVGKKRLLVAGLVVMCGGILLASGATRYNHLVLAQAIAGVGGSTFHPTGMSIISDVETNKTEGRAMGVFGFGGAVGTLAAPVLVGGVGAVAGWRFALAGAVALGILTTVVFVLLFRDGGTNADDTSSNSHSVLRTKEGSESSSGDFSSSNLDDDAVDRISTPSLLSRLRSVLYHNDIRSSTRLMIDGTRSALEMISVSLTSSVVVLFLVTLLLSVQHKAIQTFTTSYIITETGASLSIGNVAFFLLLLGGSISSLWVGDLADQFNRKLLGIATAAATASLVGATIFVAPVLGWLPTDILFGILAVWFFVLGVAMYASYPVKNALISEQAETEFSGSLFGIIQTASAIGSATGPAVFGVLSTRWGVAAAFPAIAVVSVLLASSFVLLFYVSD